jgi:hypothetical protein
MERIKKMYFEAIGIFITTNLTYRTDGNIPDCFSAMPPEPDIDNFSVSIIIPNSENQ